MGPIADNTQVGSSADILATDDLSTLNGGASGTVKVQRVDSIATDELTTLDAQGQVVVTPTFTET